nr:MAG TPA: hypothetical protein [Caudoviricetes sp.]
MYTLFLTSSPTVISWMVVGVPFLRFLHTFYTFGLKTGGNHVRTLCSITNP